MTFENVKVGDTVLVTGGYGRNLYLRTVTAVSKAEEYKAEQEHFTRARYLRDVKYAELPRETVKAIYDHVCRVLESVQKMDKEGSKDEQVD